MNDAKQAETILQFIYGLRGSLHVTFEEGTCTAWLHDLLEPRVTEVLVCDPSKNNLAKVGNKNDRNDACELAELLYRGKLRSVCPGEHGMRTLEGTGTQLLGDHPESDARDERTEDDLPKLGYFLYRSAAATTPKITFVGKWKGGGNRKYRAT